MDKNKEMTCVVALNIFLIHRRQLNCQIHKNWKKCACWNQIKKADDNLLKILSCTLGIRAKKILIIFTVAIHGFCFSFLFFPQVYVSFKKELKVTNGDKRKEIKVMLCFG